MKMKAMDPQTRKTPTITIPISTRRSHSSNYYDSSSTTPTPSHLESPHSPLRFHSPLHSDHGDPPDHSPYASPDPSPPKQRPPDSSKAVSLENVPKFSSLRPHRFPSPETSPEKPSEAVVVLNRAVREDGAPAVRKVGPGEEREGGKERAVTAILRRSRRGEVIRMVELGFRICEVVFCLISFSVMAADKTRGWSGDSFDRYIEYRYCLSVNVIACIYSGFQANDLVYHLITGKHVLNHHLRYHFIFFMDQILAYLLISASSSAATRVDDWQSNWGKDEFTIMASASVAMAFLAFAAFAISSLISGYNLCNREEA